MAGEGACAKNRKIGLGTAGVHASSGPRHWPRPRASATHHSPLPSLRPSRHPVFRPSGDWCASHGHRSGDAQGGNCALVLQAGGMNVVHRHPVRVVAR
eukprot:scaffold27424_cov84-Isochrysis_galbana.AAC.2